MGFAICLLVCFATLKAQNIMDFSDLNITPEYLIDIGGKLAIAIITLIIGFRIIKWISKIVHKSLEKQEVEVSLRKFLSSLISVGLKVLLLLSVAGMVGIKTTAFIAVFSAIAFAIGLALQGSLGHFASGVMVLLFKPYKVGDLVEIGGGIKGVVESIEIFNTILKTPDLRKIFVPNGTVTSNPIINFSGRGIMGMNLTFGIGYDDDIDKARTVLEEIIKKQEKILKDPPPVISINELGDSSVNFICRPFCKSDYYWEVYYYMHETVKKEFDKHGIGIPYPQMDIHLDK